MNQVCSREPLLKKIRVLDLSRVMSGPFCTSMLADLGAEIIKVEMPNAGDQARFFGPYQDNESTYFTLLNRDKKSISINLKRKGSIKLLEQKEFDLQNIDLASPDFRTNFSSNYLRWRYLDKVYKVAKFEKDSIQVLLFYKLEKVKGVKTLIIQDILGDCQMHKAAVTALANYINVYVVFFLNTPLLNLNFYISKKRHNSIVVIKGDKEKIPASLSFSAGDLEGSL